MLVYEYTRCTRYIRETRVTEARVCYGAAAERPGLSTSFFRIGKHPWPEPRVTASVFDQVAAQLIAA